ncbi:MAG: SpvB/TcaC N-terminal domain-containing protein, partial [Kofleriaceae bacterium]
MIELDRAEPIAAIKVYGPAPYTLDVRGALGFEPIDLSALDRGWHVFTTNVITSTRRVELQFHALGADGGVPEVELWAQAQHLPAPRGSVDLTAEELPPDYVRVAAMSPADEVSPGNCVEFGLTLARPPELFRSAHVVYDAKGVFRAFSLTRTINGLGEQGGSWLAGNNDGITIIDEIDPANLRLGDNAVRLCTPASASQRVTVSNLRLVGELDTGTSLAESVAVGGRDGAALLDGDPNTSIDVAAREHVTVNFDRLIAVNALVLTGTNIAAPDATCVVSPSITRSVAVNFQKSTDGALLGFDDGAMSCSALDLSFPGSTSLSALDLIGSGAAERVDWARIVTTNTAEHFGTKAWVGGFVARPPSMTGAIRVEVGDQKATSKAGNFGQLLERQDALPTWSVTVTAHLPDGTTTSRQVLLDRDHHAQLDQATSASPTPDTTIRPDSRFARAGDRVDIKVATGAPSKIRLGSAVGLDVPAGALRTPTTISVVHLDASTVPPLDPGMVNVTAPKDRAYEFLPHGQRFAKPIEVLVPFDPSLIPSEMSANDVHTFYYDTANKKWKQLTRTALDVGEHVAHSATDHFTIMIDAVLATPKNPTPLSFDPTAMSSISGALPTDNMDLIAPPEANSSGDANVSLPIRVPSGRGAFTPNLSVGYSSTGTNDWLGVGWNLPISEVSIDTRWGVPTYDQPQRYALDGAELIPTNEAEGPLCQNGTLGHRYHPRVEGGFAHIVSCETGVGMHFEVHDRDGTLFVYGDDPAVDPPLDPRHASLADPADASHIARWALAKVVDIHGNTTIFHYAVDNVPTTEPGREIYPSSIAYTSGGATTAAYRIDFQIDDGTRPDVITSGRSGFKTTVRHLLRALHVSYRGQIIRDYVFTYQHGQFQKTTLANVRVYGTGGCATFGNAFVAPSCGTTNFFNEHTFEYFQETEAFGPSTHLLMGGTAAAQRMPLATGATQSRNGGLSESIRVLPGVDVSFGMNVQTSSRSEVDGLYDFNGDGLPDQVYVDGSGITALYNQSVPGVDPTTHVLFAPDPTKSIVGLTSLGAEGGSSWSENLGVSTWIAVNGTYSDSSSSANRRLVDIDGDGYLDFMSARSRFG